MSSYLLGDSNSVFIELDGFDNLSEPGFRVKNVLERLSSLTSGDTIILAIGVNDSATITNTKSGNKVKPDLESFKATYSEILSLAKTKFKRVICVGLISSTEEEVIFGDAKIKYSNKTITEFNTVVKKLCEESEVEFVDLLPYFLGHEDELLSDHIHPNTKGYDLIVKEVSNYVE